MPFRTIKFDGVTFDHLIITNEKHPNGHMDTYRHVILSGEDGETVNVSSYTTSFGYATDWYGEVIFHAGTHDERAISLPYRTPRPATGGTKAWALKQAIAYIKERRAELAEQKRGVA